MSYNQAESILHDLVEIPSVTENIQANNQVLEYVADFLGARGLGVEERIHDGYGSLVATSRDTMTPEVMLVAHADVVPGPDELFRLREDDQNFYGRGVFDMKCAIAGYLALVDELGSRRHDYDFGVKIVTNEEIGGKGVKHLLDEGFVPKVAVLPDGSKDWRIESLAKGAWNVAVTVEGKEAHGARPWEGENAADKLIDLIVEARELFKNQGPSTDTLNTTMLSGGNAINSVPATAGATLDIRVASRESLAAIKEKITEICARYGTEPELQAFFAPVVHDVANSYIRQFAKSIEATIGVEAGNELSSGSCDAVYYDALNIPCVVTKPEGGGAHSDDEWISKRGFNQIVPVLGHYLTSLRFSRL